MREHSKCDRIGLAHRRSNVSMRFFYCCVANPQMPDELRRATTESLELRAPVEPLRSLDK